MCGRKYNQPSLSWEQYKNLFDLVGSSPTNLAPNYNIAPTHEVLVVARENDERVVKPMRWGLIPSWSKTQKMKFSTFNARAEKLEQSKLYSPALKSRRCIVPVSGFYEWKKIGPKEKQAYAIQRKDKEPLLMAGLWSCNRQISEDRIFESYTVITRESNSFVGEIHNRMPVTLKESQIEQWLDAEWGEASQCLSEAYPANNMEAFKVSNEVGNVKNNHEKLTSPI